MPPKKGKPTPQQIASSFVKQYYKVLEEDRSRLFNYYNNDSQFLHQEGTAEGTSVVGKEEIKTAVFALFGKNTPIKVDYLAGTLDAQQGSDGGVVLLVTGTMTIDYKGEKERARTFVQTFYLAPSQATEKSASYYVLNDTFRILDPPKAASAPSAPKPKTVPAKKEAPKPKETPIPKSEPAPKLPLPPSPEPEPEPELEPEPEPELEPMEPTGPLTWAQRAAKTKAAQEMKKAQAPKAPKAALPSPQAPVPQASAPPAAQAPPVKAAAAVAFDPLSLYVKGLPDGTSDDQLRVIFEGYGDIKNISIKEDRGYAFVDFKAAESAATALKNADSFELGETKLSVEPRKAAGKGGKGKGGKGKGGKGRGSA